MNDHKDTHDDSPTGAPPPAPLPSKARPSSAQRREQAVKEEILRIADLVAAGSLTRQEGERAVLEVVSSSGMLLGLRDYVRRQARQLTGNYSSSFADTIDSYVDGMVVRLITGADVNGVGQGRRPVNSLDLKAVAEGRQDPLHWRTAVDARDARKFWSRHDGLGSRVVPVPFGRSEKDSKEALVENYVESVGAKRFDETDLLRSPDSLESAIDQARRVSREDGTRVEAGRDTMGRLLLVAFELPPIWRPVHLVEREHLAHIAHVDPTASVRALEEVYRNGSARDPNALAMSVVWQGWTDHDASVLVEMSRHDPAARQRVISLIAELAHARLTRPARERVARLLALTANEFSRSGQRPQAGKRLAMAYVEAEHKPSTGTLDERWANMGDWTHYATDYLEEGVMPASMGSDLPAIRDWMVEAVERTATPRAEQDSA